MARRYHAEEEVERVPAGGGYDEWFDVRTYATLGDALRAGQYKTNAERTTGLLTMMIADWSLTDASGQKLPVNEATVAGLKGELLAPVLEKLGAMTEAFLALASAIKSAMS